MKYFGVWLWVSLVVDVFVCIIIWLILGSQPPEWESAILSFLPYLLITGLVMQIASLFLLKHKAGTVLACVGSLCLLPLGLFFFLAYQFSRHRCIYSGLVEVKQPLQKPLNAIYYKSHTPALFIIQILLGTVVIFMGLSIGGILIVAGIAGLINNQRFRAYPFLAEDNGNIIFTPAMASPTFIFPQDSIRLTELTKRKATFLVTLPDAGEKKISLVRRSLEEDNLSEHLAHYFPDSPELQLASNVSVKPQ